MELRRLLTIFLEFLTFFHTVTANRFLEIVQTTNPELDLCNCLKPKVARSNWTKTCSAIFVHSAGAPWKGMVEFQIEDKCIAPRKVTSVILQAINIHGFPFGHFEERLEQVLVPCAYFNSGHRYTIETQPCEYFDKPELYGHYATPYRPSNVFHYYNAKQEFVNGFCVRWNLPIFPKHPYPAYSQPFQIYVLILTTIPGKQDSDLIWEYRSKYTYTFKNGIIEKTKNINPLRINIDYYEARVKGSQRCLEPPYPLEIKYNTCLRYRPTEPRVYYNDINTAQMWKKCFQFEAFPLSNPYKVHLKFRQFPKLSDPECKVLLGTEIVIYALNNEGFPTGDLRERINIYNDAVAEEDKCEDEDLIYRWPFEYAERCFLYDNDVYKFLQHIRQNEAPWALKLRIRPESGGFCSTWTGSNEYESDLPTDVQFMAEVYVPGYPPRSEGSVLTIRTKKFGVNPSYIFPASGRASTKSTCHKKGQGDMYKEKAEPSNPKLLPSYHLNLSSTYYRECEKTKVCHIHLPRDILDPVTRPEDTITERDPNPIPDLDHKRIQKGIKEIIYDGCFWFKGCVTDTIIQHLCVQTKVCEVIFSYGKMTEETPKENEVVWELYAREANWMAVGFSDNNTMLNSYVVECVSESGSVEVYESWNYLTPDGKKSNKRLKSGDQSHAFRLIESGKEESSIYCKLYIKRNLYHINPITRENLTVDLAKATFIIMARGNIIESGVNGNIKQHAENERYNFGKRQIPSKRISPSDDQIAYLTNHGILMIVSWVFLVSIGSFIGRYYKSTWVNIQICKVQLWLVLHVGIMLLALALTGFATYYQLIGKYGWKDLRRSVFHSLTGLLSGAALLCNFLLGFCIPNRKPGTYNTYIVVHGVVGHTMFFLAMSNIMKTETILFAWVPCDYSYLGLSYTIVYVIINIVMSYHHLWIKWIMGRQPHTEASISQLHFNALVQSSMRIDEMDSTPKVDSPGTYIRVIILVIFIFLACMVSIALILRSYFTESPCYKSLMVSKSEEITLIED